MLRFHHAPWSRGSATLWLLEELGAEYELVLHDIRADGGADEAYRSIQPNKKVPAIEHDGTIVTERAAITIYLADAFPEAGLAVPPGDPDRARYLTWNVYCDSVIDPCVVARARGLSYESNDYSFGLFDDMVANVERHLSEHDFAAGSRFTAADVQLASTIDFCMNNIHVLPERLAFKSYLERALARTAHGRAAKRDQALAMQTPYFQNQAAGAQPT